MIGQRAWRDAAIDLAAVLVMLSMAMWGFAPVFATGAWIPAGVGAVVIGAGLAVAALRWRWSLLALAGAVIGAYFVAGGPLAVPSTALSGVVPTLGTVTSLATGAVSTWKAMLTADVPTAGLEVVHLVPFIAGMIATVAAVILALRSRPGLAMIPVIGLLAVSVAFGLYRVAAPVAQGAVVALVALGWLGWRRAQARAAGQDALAAEHSAATLAASRRRRAMGAAALVASAGLGGAALVGFAGPDADREVLRDEVVPPLELRDYPSPLQSFRKWVRDYDDVTLFTVDHLPAGTRVRLATLDAYDGIVYSVSGDGSATGGSFQRVGQELPVESVGDREDFTVTMGALGGVWVPSVGDLAGMSFATDQSDPLNRSLHYNAGTGTVVQTQRLGEGQQYSFSAVIAPQPAPDALASADFARIPPPAVSVVPESARTTAVEAIDGAQGAYAQASALADYLAGAGFFSHGLEGQAASLSGHRAERVGSLLSAEQMIGDDEQYAVAYALMAHELGIPARVVMGFYPETYGSGPFEATGDTVHVWVEVAFEGYGWVTIDPSPAEDQAPIDEEQSPQREPKPRVLQPPPPPEPPAEEPPTLPSDEELIPEPEFDVEAALRILVIAAAAAGSLLVLLGPILGVIIAKARRRAKRRRAAKAWDALSGGWMEIADLATDYRVAVPGRLTRGEGALLVDTAFDTAQTAELARRADEGVWAPGEPTRDEITAFWGDVQATMRTMHRSRPWRSRIAARLSLRSIAQRRAEARQARRNP